VLATVDRDDPAYQLDGVSVIESVLDDPRQILYAQQHAAKGAEVARMKAEGIEYEERMERLESVTWPMPLKELLDACIQPYRGRHPWVADGPSPKSILREMLESGDTFASFIRRYRLDRSEGLLLRYLTDAWRTLDRSLPDDVYTDGLEDVVEWLGALIRATDATLLDEWARLAGQPVHGHEAPEALTSLQAGPPAAWRTAMRTATFAWVELLARRSHVTLAERWGWEDWRIRDTMRPYWDEYDSIGIDGDARSAQYFCLTEEPGRWHIEQTLVDPEGDGAWRLRASVDIETALADGAPSLQFEGLGPIDNAT
jgi:hypothetical protein